MLTFLIFDISLIIHLPILYTDAKEWNLNFYNLLLNMTTIAGLWMICRNESAITKSENSASLETNQRRSDKTEPTKGKLVWQRKKKNN